MRIHPTETKNAELRIVAAGIELKLAGDAFPGLVTGYGSVFNVQDLHGDIVEPGAFASSLSEHKTRRAMPPMLWSHDPERPVGVWDTIVEDAHGLKVSGRLNLDTQDGREARALLKQGAFNGLSIGFRINAGGSSMDRSGIRRLKSIELWEISLVTMPSNQAARIDGVKSMTSARDFEGFLRASGFPKSAARKIAAGGWPALRSDDTGTDDLLAAVRKATTELRKG